MPPKAKKVSDKDAIWEEIRDISPEKPCRCHVEFIYKLRLKPVLHKHAATNDSNSLSTCGSDFSDTHSTTATSSSSSRQSTSSNKQSHSPAKPTSLSNSAKEIGRMEERASDCGVTEMTPRQSHSSCRKNCASDPFCLKSLGFEKWLSGDMDYDWPSDDDEDDCLIKRKKEIPVGLVNLGATCYVNAFLQLWYHNLAFRNAVFEWRPNQEDGFNICDSLQYIFGLLELSHRSCADPSSLIEFLGLDASQQQDAQEFSKLFIDLLPCPQVKNMFSGSYDYVTRCSTCKHESRTASQFSELDLSIEGLNTLDDCMKSFLQVEKLIEDNQYFCSKCQCKQNATRRIQLRKLPPVLNIQLLRFVFDRKTGHKKKLNTCLQFPDQLDLADLVSSREDQHQYELTAVLMHSGMSAFSGHYTAHIRKLDHWYSFNDANVAKLKGKKLNLANEESLDYNPDAVNMSSESRKKGNRSKNAYMLVYQNKSFIQSTKDLQPSPVPENIQMRVAEDNSKMSSSNHEAEIKQTEEMVRVEMKKDQVTELWEDILPTSDTENFHFLPTSWIYDSVKNWADIKPVDTSTLLCCHGKLNWTLNSKYKVISEAKGKFVYSTYRDDNTVVLNRKDSLCYECVKNQLIWRKMKHKVEEDNKRITTLLSSESDGANPPSGRARYWLSKSELRRWRSLYLQPLERAAQPTERANKSSHGADSKNGEGSNAEAHNLDLNASSVGSVANQSNCSNGFASASSSVSGDSAEVNGESHSRFNSDVRCDHGNLDADEKYRQLVSQSVWDILVEYFPDAVAFNDTHQICKQCLGAQEEMGAIEEQRKARVKLQRQVLPDLAALRNRPNLAELTTDSVFCLTVDSYKQWKLFLRNPSTQSGIESIVNGSIICPHDMICVHPSDENSVVLLWPYEWDLLSSHFPFDMAISVKSRASSAPNDTPYYTIPDMCADCMQSRLLSEELESHNFTSAKIYVRLLDDEKKDSDQSINQQSFPEESTALPTDGGELPPETKKLKVDPLQPDANIGIVPIAKRRSGRRKHVRGDKQIRASSSTTLKELRVELVKLFAIAPFDQVLMLDGTKLEGEGRTLAELRLYPDCLLLLKGELFDESNMEQALVQQGVLEEGFRGTGLIADNSSFCSNSKPS